MRMTLSILLTIAGLCSVLGTSNAFAEGNCRFDAAATSNNFYSEDNLNSFESCSFFIRSALLSKTFSWLAGGQTEGTLTYKSENGSKKVCDVVLLKDPPEALSRNEGFAGYIKAEQDGGAVSKDDQKANEILRKLGVDLSILTKKVNDSIEVRCMDPLS